MANQETYSNDYNKNDKNYQLQSFVCGQKMPEFVYFGTFQAVTERMALHIKDFGYISSRQILIDAVS